MNKSSATIRNRVREAREAQGWTQRDLADQMEVEEQTVSKWERGLHKPGLTQRKRLCKLLDVTPEYLWPQTPQEPSDSAPSQTDQPQPEEERSVPLVDALPSWSPFPSFQKDEKGRRMLLARVKETWIEGVLKHSLYQATLIVLGLVGLPEALANPWGLEVQETDLPPYPLPLGTSIGQIYDEANGQLLLLGEPGAGKTTLLLELANTSYLRAQQDEQFPTPVVLNLSGWAVKQLDLSEWIVEELQSKYRLPKKTAQAWVETDQLALLLDGLDEVAEHARPACIKAISMYQKHHALGSLVVCCRREEYFAQATRLAFQKAVLIQPLTREQVDDYLSRAGGQLVGVRQALEDDRELRELIQTPLMLNIVALAYQGKNGTALSITGSFEQRRHAIFSS